MTAHKWHKELMAVAEASKTSSEPWTVLQTRKSCGEFVASGFPQWVNCYSAEDLYNLFNVDSIFEFRIKPRTILINGIEVNEPLRVKPEMGQRYYIAAPAYSCGEGIVLTETWHDKRYDNFFFNNGRIHLKEEDARAHVEADYAGSRPRG